jgi:isoleucyl-tRNA synthetase
MKKAQPADFPAFEAEMLKVWDKEKAFEKSLELRKDGKRFSFYDGPPFANGLPHYGHALASTEKDAVTRYKTMRGYYVPRRAGWDTHGLPVEYEVEKQLGLSGKQQIMEMGIDKFNQACRDSVFKYRTEWEQFLRRFGRWIDLDNAYATLDDSFIESVWWVFAEIYKKGLVYEGFKSMPYCPRCATPLSNFELNQGYQDNVQDPSVFPLFTLKDDPQTALLAWTTTPWTLPANAALAVRPEADYVTVELHAKPDEWTVERLILAKARLSELELRKSEFKVVKTQKGSELVGLHYDALYPHEGTDSDHSVIESEAVSLEDGTGILHVAPRYGEDDLQMGLKHELTLIESVDANGKQVKGPEESLGLFFKEADPHIISDLTQKGRIYAAETFSHTYPFCWRCDSPLLYFATPSWFVKVTELADKLVANNKQITWVPGHVKEGRFGNWLAEARDWSISRNRFWGAPLPVWQCSDGHTTVVASIAELRQKAINAPEDVDMHRPGIDSIQLKCDDCGKEATRIEQVFDCWFESGSMPYAEDHYPFENEQAFEHKFPADFIAESMDQTRGWFYTLHVLATALFDKPAFENVIVSGIVVAADGRKLSKRLKNYPDPQEIFDRFGVDSLRFFLCLSPAVAGEDVRFSADTVAEVYRNVFSTLYNVHSFLTTYAEIDGWQPKELREPDSSSVLDQWMLARLNETISEVTKQADAYHLARATRPVRDLIEDLSNWYVRRSRRRFSKNEDQADKAQAFATLHYVLVRVCQLMAPWSPFLPDRLWRELTEGMKLPDSVHLSDWPEAGKVDEDLLAQMQVVRQFVTEGLAQRAQAGIKVRQPLAEATLTTQKPLAEQLVQILCDELNVKKVIQKTGSEPSVSVDTKITQELKEEGMVRDLIRHIQSHRKAESLQINDQIDLTLGTDSPELKKAIEAYSDLLRDETLATKLTVSQPSEGVPVKVGEATVTIDFKVSN